MGPNTTNGTDSDREKHRRLCREVLKTGFSQCDIRRGTLSLPSHMGHDISWGSQHHLWDICDSCTRACSPQPLILQMSEFPAPPWGNSHWPHQVINSGEIQLATRNQ